MVVSRALRGLRALAVALACLASPGIVGPVLAAAPLAESAREESRVAFRRGVACAQRGDYACARGAFVDAYRLYPHPSILLNLGIVRWKLGEYVSAEQDLLKFLSEDRGASKEDVTSAQTALDAVRSKIGKVHLRIVPDSGRATIDGQPVALVPGQLAEVRAAVGEHVLEVHAEGFVSRRELVVFDASRDAVVEVRLEPGSSPQVEEDRLRRPEPRPSTRRVVGWSLVGTAGAAAVLGVVAGLRAQSLSHEYNTAPAGEQSASTRSTGILFRTTADVAFAAALVSGGVGAYLVLSSSSSDPAHAKVSGVIGPAFLGLRGRF